MAADTEQTQSQPNKKPREVAQRIVDVLDEEGITGMQERVNTMLIATMSAGGLRGYQWLVDTLLKGR